MCVSHASDLSNYGVSVSVCVCRYTSPAMLVDCNNVKKWTTEKVGL